MPIEQQLLIAAAMIAAIVLMGWGILAMGRSTGRDIRQQELRESEHMDWCTRGLRCYHPDHVHEEPEPDFYDRLEAIRAPRGFLERMGS